MAIWYLLLVQDGAEGGREGVSGSRKRDGEEGMTERGRGGRDKGREKEKEKRLPDDGTLL